MPVLPTQAARVRAESAGSLRVTTHVLGEADSSPTTPQKSVISAAVATKLVKFRQFGPKINDFCRRQNLDRPRSDDRTTDDPDRTTPYETPPR